MVERLLGHHLHPPRDPHARGDLGHQRRVELPVQGARGGHRHREVGALVAGRAGLDRRRRHDRRARLGGQLAHLGVERAGHERRAAPHDGELLARDVGHRRAEPARVLEPDVGEHHDRRAEHVGGVVAAAEAGLDDRDLDALARELGERGGGQQLELRDAVALLERAVDLGGRRRGALHGRAEGVGAEVGVADPDPLGERGQVRRQERAGAHAVGLEQRRASCARSTTCRWCRPRGSRGSAPAGCRARSAAGACARARSACRTARARAGGPRRLRGARRSQVGQLPLELLELARAPSRPPRRAPWPRSPGWRACPRRGRSPSRASPAAPRRAWPRPRGRPPRRRARGRCRRGRRRWRPARRRRPTTRRARAGRCARPCGRSPRPRAGRGRPCRPRRRRGRASRAAPAWRRSRAGRRPRRPRRAARRRARGSGGPAAGRRRRARCAHSSSVTNGMIGCASASVSPSTNSASSTTSRLSSAYRRGLIISRYQSHSSP